MFKSQITKTLNYEINWPRKKQKIKIFGIEFGNLKEKRFHCSPSPGIKEISQTKSKIWRMKIKIFKIDLIHVKVTRGSSFLELPTLGLGFTGVFKIIQSRCRFGHWSISTSNRISRSLFSTSCDPSKYNTTSRSNQSHHGWRRRRGR